MLVTALGIADGYANQKTIELVLRKMIGALELKWILRRHQHERPLERIRAALDADLLFAHRFQQR